MAAVRIGVRHVRQKAGAGTPLVLVGYSNGGALVMRYALEAAGDPALPALSRLVLLSPMIGVSPLARMARIISALGPLPFFEKARWLDVVPEYNPFKYNSFPANAANQSYRVSSALQAEVDAAVQTGTIAQCRPSWPSSRSFDTTVSTEAVVRALFDRLPAGDTSWSSSTSTAVRDSSRSSAPGTRRSWPRSRQAGRGPTVARS